MENTQTISKTPKLKLDFKDSKYATGRRKTSIAKVWLKKGSGKIYVNGKLFNEYFTSEFHHLQITRPFDIIKQPTDFDVRSNVSGGGHTGHPGGIKETTPEKLHEKKPGETLKLAVKRMLPGGVLGRKQLTKLKIYSGSDHPHAAQNPEVIELGKLNSKNLVRN